MKNTQFAKAEMLIRKGIEEVFDHRQHHVIRKRHGGGDWATTFVQGNTFSVSINAESREEADTLFADISVHGQVTMLKENTFWGSYFGMFTDKFGIYWMVNFDEQIQ